MDQFTSFEWDRVYAFEGYSEPAEINAAVGAEVYYGDGYLGEDMLLVFMSGDEIAHASRVFPSIGYPKRPLFSREDAVLKIGRLGLRFAGPGRPGQDG